MEAHRPDCLQQQRWFPYNPEWVYSLIVTSIEHLNSVQGESPYIFHAARETLLWFLGEMRCPLEQLCALCTAVYALTAKQQSTADGFLVEDAADEILLFFWAYKFNVTRGCVSLDDLMKTEALVFHMLGCVVPRGDPKLVCAFKKYVYDKRLGNGSTVALFNMVARILQTTVTPEVLGLSHRVLFVTIDFAMRSLGKTDEHSIRDLVLHVADLHYKRGRARPLKRKRGADEPEIEHEVRRGPQVDAEGEEDHEAVLH